MDETWCLVQSLDFRTLSAGQYCVFKWPVCNTREDSMSILYESWLDSLYGEVKFSLTATKGTAAQYMEDSMPYGVWKDMPEIEIMLETVCR